MGGPVVLCYRLVRDGQTLTAQLNPFCLYRIIKPQP